MFPKITINAKNTFSQLGLLSESLIYYQHSNLILDPGSFPDALSIIGYENLVELIREGDLSVNLNLQSLGVGNPGGTKYMIGSFSSKNHSKGRIVTESTEKLWGRSIKSENRKKHLLKLVGEHSYMADYNKLLLGEMLDIENFKDSIVTSSKGAVNRDDIDIEISKDNNGLFDIKSNCEKNLIEDSANLICIGSGLLYDSITNSSELITNSTIATYPTSRIQRLLDKRTGTEKQIKNFHEFVLPEFCDLKSTVDSGAKQFDEFMELWREAKKFKVWLKDEEPNVELLTAYIRKISEKSWLDKIPVKTLRWILFTSAGLTVGDIAGGVAGTAASVGVDLLDSLFLDGIVKRSYKPNQFVENEYKDYLNLGI